MFRRSFFESALALMPVPFLGKMWSGRGPRRTAASVVQELQDGLLDGSVRLTPHEVSDARRYANDFTIPGTDPEDVCLSFAPADDPGYVKVYIDWRGSRFSKIISLERLKTPMRPVAFRATEVDGVRSAEQLRFNGEAAILPFHVG